jgi:adenylylsulfate kinase-like enzyme
LSIVADPGVDSPCEPPEVSEVRVTTIGTTAEEAAAQIIDELRRRGII